MMMRPARTLPAAHRAPVSVDPPGLVGRKVRLRGIRPADHRRLIGFDRDAEQGRSRPVGEFRHWAGHRSDATDSGDDTQFAIEALHGRMLVGSINTVQSDPLSGGFSYGIGIGRPHRRCGYAGDAITILLRCMFEQHGYGRCDVSIYGGNLASLTLHGGLGFREVGRLRDTELLRGGVRYLVLMSITAAEFAAADGGSGPAPAGRGRHWRARRGRHRPSARLN